LAARRKGSWRFGAPERCACIRDLKTSRGVPFYRSFIPKGRGKKEALHGFDDLR
jgi:hypothetical protein